MNPLSPSERRTLVAVVEAGSERRAAARLRLSEGTVHKQMAHVRDKLGARSTAQAFLFAVQRRYVDLNENAA